VFHGARNSARPRGMVTDRLTAVGCIIWVEAGMHRAIPHLRTKHPAGARRQAKGQVALEQTFLLGPLTCQFARAAHRLGLFTGPAFRRLFKILPHFHFAEDALTLQFLFQGTKRLIDIIVANTDLYQWSSPSKFAVFQ